MDSDEEFYGRTRRASKPAERTETEPDSDSEPTESERSSEPHSSEDNSEKTASESEETESEKEEKTESDSERTEDDPLSDVWDSDDNENELEDAVAVQHNYITVPSSTGAQHRIDLCPPDQLLIEAEQKREKYYKERNSEKCIREAVRCLALTRIVFGDRASFLLAKCHTMIAKAYWELNEWPKQCHSHAETASKLLAKVPEKALVGNCGNLIKVPSKEEFLELSILTHYLLGKGLLAMKRVSEAEQSFTKANNLLTERKEESEMKNKHFWSTELLTALARVKVCQKRPGAALKNLELVRKLLEKKYGKGSPKIIPLLHEMAKLEQSKGEPEDFESAVELCQQSYDLAKGTEDDSSELMGLCARALALAHSKLTSEEAQVFTDSYLNEAISCYQISVGKCNKNTLETQELLAKHYASTERLDEAASYFGTVLPNFAECYGEFHAKTAAAHKLMAEIHLQSGNATEGARELKQVLEIESQIFGQKHVRTETTRQALNVLLKNPSLGYMKSGAKMGNRPRFQTIVKVPSLLAPNLY